MSASPRSDRAGYVPGYGSTAHQYMTTRTAAGAVDFLIPHLRPDMRLLDCGCGPGSITVGLAEIVSAGEVVGIDREPLQVERARAHALERGVDNVRFETGDLFHLPFPDDSFDAVFAHAVLMHVGDRFAALSELRRVTRPGGLVAVKDIKTDDQIIEPSTPILRKFFALTDRLRRHNGVEPSAPHAYRSLFRRAGFMDVEGVASCTSYGTLDATTSIAMFHLGMARGEAFQRTAKEQGWATQADLDEICTEIQAWGSRPDAFRVELWGAAIGRKPS